MEHKQEKHKLSGYRALEIFVAEVIGADWDHQVDVRVPKIKALFHTFLPDYPQRHTNTVITF